MFSNASSLRCNSKFFASKSDCNKDVSFAPDNLSLSYLFSKTSFWSTILSYCVCNNLNFVPNSLVSIFNEAISFVKTKYLASISLNFP